MATSKNVKWSVKGTAMYNDPKEVGIVSKDFMITVAAEDADEAKNAAMTEMRDKHYQWVAITSINKQ